MLKFQINPFRDLTLNLDVYFFQNCLHIFGRDFFTICNLNIFFIIFALYDHGKC